VRIVLDTNVLLAAFGTRGLCEGLLAACLEEHVLVTSNYILTELARHLTGRFRMNERRAREIVAFVREQSELVEPEVVAPGTCRDVDDLPIIGTALAGGADLLVTGDGDLLSIRRHGTLDIVSPRECYQRLV
jgi:putative PIN family toxin of toxin-antitoxin system